MKTTAPLFLFVLLAGCASQTQAPAAPAPPAQSAPTPPAADAPPLRLIALRFLAGPKWVAGKSPMEQPGIEEHVANMHAWSESGRVYMGGPFLDGTGGMAVLRVGSVDEAMALARQDPGVVSGLLVPEAHPWLAVFHPGNTPSPR